MHALKDHLAELRASHPNNYFNGQHFAEKLDRALREDAAAHGEAATNPYADDTQADYLAIQSYLETAIGPVTPAAEKDRLIAEFEERARQFYPNTSGRLAWEDAARKLKESKW